jgi:hypothetical protein
MALAGDSAALRRAISAQHQQNTGQPPYPDQAHHLLCSNVVLKLERKYSDLAEKAGYDLNRASNGLLMPAKYGHQMRKGLQRHCGGHCKKLYADVNDLLESVYEPYKDKKDCPDDETLKNILGDLKVAEEEARRNIKALDWQLYNNSKDLFDGDYRDEGAGDLKFNMVDPQAFTGKASGLQWLRRYASGLKRRYELVSGKEEVRKQFYNREGYPVPADPRA